VRVMEQVVGIRSGRTTCQLNPETHLLFWLLHLQVLFLSLNIITMARMYFGLVLAAATLFGQLQGKCLNEVAGLYPDERTLGSDMGKSPAIQTYDDD
jgi:hypothetical protein